MTDQRYDGPDGAKRLEMLEELARLVSQCINHVRPHHMSPRMCRITRLLGRDNERVDRLEKEREKRKTEPLWGWFIPDPLD